MLTLTIENDLERAKTERGSVDVQQYEQEYRIQEVSFSKHSFV